MSHRIMQFGTSRFLQAHADLFVHEAREAGADVGPITVVKTTPDGERAGRVAAFGKPDGYPVIIRGIERGERIEHSIQVTSVVRGLSTGADWPEVMRRFAGETDIVISNVGDAGYALIEGETAGVPASFPGKLLALLLARHAGGALPLLILPCELIGRNGDTLRSLVRGLAERDGAPAAFLQWLDADVHFANTLVDRIVSEPIEPIGAVAEPYALWAIEAGPAIDLGFAHPAIVVTDDLDRYARLKLFILNLSHTLLADRWMRQGRPENETVFEMLSDPAQRRWIENVVEAEIVPLFAQRSMGEDAARYWRETLERLLNPFLQHRLREISGNHATKIERRAGALLAWAGRGNVPTPALDALVESLNR